MGMYKDRGGGIFQQNFVVNGVNKWPLERHVCKIPKSVKDRMMTHGSK